MYKSIYYLIILSYYIIYILFIILLLYIYDKYIGYSLIDKIVISKIIVKGLNPFIRMIIRGIV